MNQPLRCTIEKGNQLVIRIGLDTLALAASHIPADKELTKVIDTYELARDVCGQLNKEEEDGTTPLHLLFDKAIVDAFDDGSIAFAEE